MTKDKNYYHRNKSKRNKESSEYLKKNPHKVHQYGLKRKYGITIAYYEKLLKRQRGRCAICRQPERLKRRLAVDHNHRTNQVRGLLCFSCNTALARFERYGKRMHAYLERHK